MWYNNLLTFYLEWANHTQYRGRGWAGGWAGGGPWGIHMLQTNALKASTHVTVELAILFLSVTAFSTCLLHA